MKNTRRLQVLKARLPACSASLLPRPVRYNQDRYRLYGHRIRSAMLVAVSVMLGSCSTNNSLSDEDVTAVIQGTEVEFVTDTDDAITAYYRSSIDNGYYVQDVSSMGELVGDATATSFTAPEGTDVSIKGKELWHSIHRYSDHDEDAFDARHDVSSIGSKIFAYRYDESEPLWTIQLEDSQHCHRNAVDADANLYCWTDQELLMINPEGGVSSTGMHGIILDEENEDGDAFFIAGRFFFFSATSLDDADNPETTNSIVQTDWTVYTPYSGQPASKVVFATSAGGGVLTAPATFNELIIANDENTLFVQHPSDQSILVSRVDIRSGERTHSARLNAIDETNNRSPKALTVSTGQVDVDINREVHTLSAADLTTITSTSVKGTLLSATSDYLFTSEENASSTWVRRFNRGSISNEKPVEIPSQDQPADDSTLDQAPINLIAEVYSDSAFELFWEVPGAATCPCTHIISVDGKDIGEVSGTSFYQDGYSAGEYTLNVQRINALQETSATATVTVQLGQVMTPDEMPLPAGVRYTLYSPNTLELFWDNPDPGLVVSFEIYRDGVLLDTRNSTSFFDQGLTPDTEYVYGITALDAFGNRSLTAFIRLRTDPEALVPEPTPEPVPEPTPEPVPEPEPVPPPVDETPTPDPAPVEPPAGIQAPTNLHWTALSDHSMRLEWDEPEGAEGGVQAYEVFRNGLSYQSVSDASYIELGMDPDLDYVYTVVAVDWYKNRSAVSDPITVRIRDQRPDAQTPVIAPEDESGDDVPNEVVDDGNDDYTGLAPGAPRNLRVSVYSENSMELFWDAAIDPDGGSIQAYEVFRNGESYASVSGTSYIEFGMDPSATYTYSIIAVDWQKNRSAMSESIQVQTGTSF